MKISVIIPAWNASKSLRRSVESVLTTSYKDLDIVIIEDGSTDSTANIARELQETYSEVVRVLTHSDGGNHGVSKSRNLGIREAFGEVVCFLDADDTYYSRRFNECIEILQVKPSVDGVFEATDYLIETDKDKHITWNLLELARFENPDEDDNRGILKRLTHSNWHTNAITVRRNVFDRCGYFDNELKVGQDLELWLRMATVCKLERATSRSPVATYHRHANNRSLLETATMVNIDVYSKYVRWSRRNGGSKEDRSVIINALREKVYGAVAKKRANGKFFDAKEVLITYGRRRPVELLSKRFWGNLSNILSNNYISNRTSTEGR